MLGKAPKLLNKVRSQIDVIDDITLRSNGTVIHNVFRTYKKSKKTGKIREDKASVPKQWPSVKAFKSWRLRHLAARRE